MKLKNYLPAGIRNGRSLAPLFIGAGFLALTSAFAADIAAPSDLLEKAIYSEETKGDIDSAMKLYQQVVAEGKASQAMAGQAQYRLGVCYYKKKDFDSATAAFEKVVKDFPDQKELVALAQDYLAGAVAFMPAPWADGEELRMDLKFPTGFKVGMASYSVTAGERNGQKTWRFASRLFAGVQQLSRVEAVADSLKPLHSRWKHSLIADAETTYSPGKAEVKVLGKDTVKNIDLEGVVYDNEEAIQLMRRLPLATNYSANLRFLSSLSGGMIVPVKVQVDGIEKVEVPAGGFECYKLELSIRQTFWYSTDPHHYLVKFEAGGVVAELNAIGKVKPDQATAYHDPEYNFSLTLPVGWAYDRHEPGEAGEPTRLALLDPDALAVTMVEARKKSSLKADSQKSLRDWAEVCIATEGKGLKELKVRPDSRQEITIGGHPALSVIGDYVDGKVKKVVYAIFLFTEQDAIGFISHTDADAFDTFKAQVTQIVQSFKN